VNQGVLAYKAQNYPRAAEFFRRVSQTAPTSAIEGKALYNLGRIFVELKEAERAAEFFKAALRLDPTDPESKYNLERLYQFVMRKQGQYSEAALEQAPGDGSDQNQGHKGQGQGRSRPTPDI
jgi:tetratricopeptide (TPR) repeat protein